MFQPACGCFSLNVTQSLKKFLHLMHACSVKSNSLRPVDCSPPGSSVHGDSPGQNGLPSPWPRDCIGRWILCPLSLLGSPFSTSSERQSPSLNWGVIRGHFPCITVTSSLSSSPVNGKLSSTYLSSVLPPAFIQVMFISCLNCESHLCIQPHLPPSTSISPYFKLLEIYKLFYMKMKKTMNAVF